jgi:hypothetical protein
VNPSPTEEREVSKTDAEWIYRCFATAYPHEAYESDPEAFWKFFHEKYPKISRRRMVKLLLETDKDIMMSQLNRGGRD